MKRSTKSTVLLVVLLIATCSGGYYWLAICQGRQLHDLRGTLLQKETEYTEYEAFAAQREALQDSLVLVRDIYANSDKVILSREDSKVSLEYFNNIAESEASNVNFTFLTGAHEAYDLYNKTDYILEGDAAFSQLYGFLWKLEHHKRLYAVQSVKLNEIKKTVGKSQTPQSYVRFGIALTGYSAKDVLDEEDSVQEVAQLIPVDHNPFRPIVQEYIPPNKDNLLEVTEAMLQGMTEDRAFVADKRGRFEVMKVGDRVYLGYLTKIDKRGGRVEFTLNKGGFIETVILRLREN